MKLGVDSLISFLKIIWRVTRENVYFVKLFVNIFMGYFWIEDWLSKINWYKSLSSYKQFKFAFENETENAKLKLFPTNLQPFFSRRQSIYSPF